MTILPFIPKESFPFVCSPPTMCSGMMCRDCTCHLVSGHYGSNDELQYYAWLRTANPIYFVVCTPGDSRVKYRLYIIQPVCVFRNGFLCILFYFPVSLHVECGEWLPWLCRAGRAGIFLWVTIASCHRGAYRFCFAKAPCPAGLRCRL